MTTSTLPRSRPRRATAVGATAKETAVKHRAIQARQDLRDHDKAAQRKAAAAQATSATTTRARTRRAAPGPGHDEPTPPLPRQHLDKPGLEADMQLKPRYQAQHYRGSGKLDGMAVLITGGDSGIGRAVAVLCAREGADVAIAYLDEHEDARKTCELIEAEGGRSLALVGDVKEVDFCNQAVAQVVKAFGKLNVLINNAAFQEHAASLDELTEERFDETFRTNIYGYFHMAKAALPHLQRGDSIINTGSVTGLRGSKELLDYSATKGAIHAFTKALAHNLADRGIRVNAVAPGPVWTPLNPADRPAREVENFGAKTHLGRPAQPEEISPAYVFLAAPCCSSYITGIVLPITGSAGDGA
ncbi:SDR family oxidoreductase [Acidovorax sp. Root70]|uniref:SDR family oxidoreductase n=1 Tax=Acidovorax sp. Root70 TaxID=1736590 RepID=UPI0006F44CAD|nr:SDR family oxidoreductase [Acidovorax sp. Root70]KRB42172.1 short-chain dehydrogenase [Acidovorax sp. Root70]